MPPTPDVLDPRDPRPAVQAALRRWLTLQAAGARSPGETQEYLAAGGLEGALRALAPPPFDPEPAVARLAELGVVAVPHGSPAYPERLARLPDAAPLLLVDGDRSVLSERCVAVVGARAATQYGRRIARNLGAELAREGLVVVSGLAYGVDAEAHRGALEAGGRTLAVQGRGPDDVYPLRHRGLARRIRESGALISELPVGTPPLAGHFPLRNRIIAALAECVVVVEARRRSGSLSTARHAAAHQTEVFAVPGPITAPASAGTNRLLADGAFAFLDIDDVLQRLGLPLRRTRRRAATARRTSERGGETARILAALEDAPATADELGRRLGRPPERLARELLELELDGLVARDTDGSLRTLAPPVAGGTRRGPKPQSLSSGSHPEQGVPE